MSTNGPSGSTGTLRALTAACVLLSAVVHLQLWAEGMRDVAVVGPAFLLNAVGGFAVAVAVLAWPHWLPLLAACGFGAATLTAFIVSVTVGLFGVHEVVTGVPQTLSAGSEVGAMVFAVAAFLVERRRREPRAAPATLDTASRV